MDRNPPAIYRRGYAVTTCGSCGAQFIRLGKGVNATTKAMRNHMATIHGIVPRIRLRR